MKKIKLGIISAIFLFLITFFYLIINDRCKSLSIFSTTSDFGKSSSIKFEDPNDYIYDVKNVSIVFKKIYLLNTECGHNEIL